MKRLFLAATMLAALMLPVKATTYLDHDETVAGLEYMCGVMLQDPSPHPEAAPGEKNLDACTVNATTKRMSAVIAIAKALQPLQDADPVMFMMGAIGGFRLTQESTCLMFAEGLVEANLVLEEGWKVNFYLPDDTLMGACPL